MASYKRNVSPEVCMFDVLMLVTRKKLRDLSLRNGKYGVENLRFAARVRNVVLRQKQHSDAVQKQRWRHVDDRIC